jgi:5'-3' exoribonuclease 1
MPQAAQAAERRGEQQPPGIDVFDSNCITPGTEFMADLGGHLLFFIRERMQNDPAWQRPRIVFSG